MCSRKSLLSVAGITLGGAGIVVCLASMVFLWMLSFRLGHLTENLFGKLDRSLVAVRERIAQTQERVQAAKITTEDVEKSFRELTRREAGQRVASQLGAGEKTERLVSTLEQADHWLDVSESSLGFIQEVLSISASINAPNITTFVEGLTNEIASLRGQLAEVRETATRIQERVAQASDEQSADERTGQLLQLTLRVVATLGSIDSRLEKTADRVSVAQSHLQELRSEMQWWIRAGTIGVTLLSLLMAAGQVALCRWAWTGFRSSDAPI